MLIPHPEPLSFPFTAPWSGVSERGRAGVSEGGGLLTPRARSCGCASCSTFLRLRLRLPPEPAVGAGGFLSCQCREAGTTPRTIPGSPSESPSEHPGDGAERRSPAQGPCKNIESGPRPPPPRFPVLRYLRAPWPPPWPCPHRARGGGIPGTRFAVTSAFGATRALARSCSAGAEPSEEAPLWGAAHTLPPSPGVPAAPSPRWPRSPSDVLPPRLSKPQPLFRAPSHPRPAGGAGGGWPTTPRGCRCWGCPRPSVPALAGDCCSWDPSAQVSPAGRGWIAARPRGCSGCKGDAQGP